MYAVILANSELQEVENAELAKSTMPRRYAWVFGPLSYLIVHNILHVYEAGLPVVDKHQGDRV
jgi:hypothetical protein